MIFKVSIYIYIHTHTYIHIYVCVHTHTHTHTHTHIILLASMATSDSCFQGKTQILVWKQISQKKNSPGGQHIILRISPFLLRLMLYFRSLS